MKRALSGSTTLVVALTVSLAGCKNEAPAEDKPQASVAVPSAPPAEAAPAPTPTMEPHGTPIPLFSGPPLLILPGEGLGPIRFGATVATIERLMNKPCEDKDEKVCRYVGRAVEFFLDDKGAVKEMIVHRGERPALPDYKRKYGIFRGRTEKGLAPLMLHGAARDMLGPPLKVEQVKDGGAAGTVEIDTYKGMKLQFDKLPNGNVVVGGIDLTKA